MSLLIDMRKSGIVLIVLILGTFSGRSSAISAEPLQRTFGLGVILGEPTGLSAKVWVSPQRAFDAGAAWSFRNKGFLHLHADYLWHFPGRINTPEEIDLYLGIGARVGFSAKDGIVGIRFPAGVGWRPQNVPIDLFIEIAPIFDLVPATGLSLNGGIGARFYFN